MLVLAAQSVPEFDNAYVDDDMPLKLYWDDTVSRIDSFKAASEGSTARK